MSQRNLGMLLTIAFVLLCSVTQLGRPDMFDKTGGMGTVNFWLGLFAAIAGLIFCIFIKTRKFGQGMMIGGGLLLLIGFSLCTGGFGLIT